MSQRASPYLTDVPLPQAWQHFERALTAINRWGPLEGEEVPLDQALHRITAEPVWAKQSSPLDHVAAMDGYAVRSAETAGASDRRPITLLLGEQGAPVDTGDVIPQWADAVVPLEEVEAAGETIRLRTPYPPWHHVRAIGEDIVATELVLPSGHRIRPADLGAIAGSGYAAISVRRKPKVVVIPSGTELVPPGKPLKPGQIVEYNSLVLAAQIEAWGGAASRGPIVPDDPAAIERALLAAEDADLILLNAGSSAGSEDYTAQVVARCGEVLVHGIAVRPGHPVLLGIVDGSSGRRIPMIGVPGYPVSAALTGEIFVRPLLERWLGIPQSVPETVEAVLTRKIRSHAGDEEYLRVALGRVGEQVVAVPLSRGAGAISSLVHADGLLRIPPGVQGYVAGEKLQVHLYRSRDEIDRTLLVLGSHDLILDLIGEELAAAGVRLVSGNLGSIGGLLALQRGEAHLSGCHLLDPETGEFNLPYLAEYLPDVPAYLVGLSVRQQGLMVAAGNPKDIHTLTDLTYGDISFVNRQRGSGTRLLLDHHLARLSVAPEGVRGYNREEYTHLAVAAAVASGRVDCGLGIQAAAAAMNLDFVPLFDERYDLVIPVRHFKMSAVERLLELLQSRAFRDRIDALPGYSAQVTGQIIARPEGA